jgi:hypothetical protein
LSFPEATFFIKKSRTIATISPTCCLLESHEAGVVQYSAGFSYFRRRDESN